MRYTKEVDRSILSRTTRQTESICIYYICGGEMCRRERNEVVYSAVEINVSLRSKRLTYDGFG